MVASFREMDERELAQWQRQLVADVLTVLMDHGADPLWQAWQDGELDRIEVDRDVVILDGKRRYQRLMLDYSVLVSDQRDPGTHVTQLLRMGDGQPIMPASLLPGVAGPSSASR
jgi:hypothetical protein